MHDNVKTALIVLILLTLCLIFPGCRKLHLRPRNVPSSAVWADGTFIDCIDGTNAGQYSCTVYEGTTGEILADGLFVFDHPSSSDKAELRYSYYHGKIVLEDGRALTDVQASELDPSQRVFDNTLKSISSHGRVPGTNCGTTTMSRPDNRVSECAKAAFENRKPFQASYSDKDPIPRSSYGLAGNENGNIYEVLYDTKGLLDLRGGRNARTSDGNRIRVTACIQPVSLARTEEGILACVTPINESESALVARQKPIETTVCAVIEDPAAFNNKLVRVRGHVSGNFEYSLLDGDGCSHSIWFMYGDDSGPPGLAAYEMGGAVAGGEDDEGKRILPIPVKLVQDSSFRRFQRLMNARVKADASSIQSNSDKFVRHRVYATFIGRIDGVSSDIHVFHLKRSPLDRADFLGFGQMGLFDAQLVVKSVESDAVLDVDPTSSGWGEAR